MTAEAASADTIVDEIDAGMLDPTTHVVVRAFHRHMRLELEVQQDALTAYDRGDPPADRVPLQEKIWAAMTLCPVAWQSGLRLSNCLVRPDEAVDWHLAEYLILWAREQGLSERQIIDAFHAGTSRR